jgi:hypothetical protein
MRWMIGGGIHCRGPSALAMTFPATPEARLPALELMPYALRPIVATAVLARCEQAQPPGDPLTEAIRQALTSIAGT